MNQYLYSLILYLLVPCIFLKHLWRSRHAPAYRKRWRERLGFCKTLSFHQPVIWVHAVSVGETIASSPLVKKLIDNHPGYRVLITTMTPTGSEQVKKIYGNAVSHVYAPYDLPCAQSRFLTCVNPVIAVMVETELWPNTIRACYQRNIPVVIANARLSARSAKGYQRLGSLTRNMMNRITTVACQNADDGERFVQLGLPRGCLQVTGSVKFDMAVDSHIQEKSKQLKTSWETGLGRSVTVLIAASTHDGEDQPIIDAFMALKKAHKDLLLLLVPRHPERFNSVYEQVLRNQLTCQRYSQNPVLTPATDVILGDTMGDLMMFYGASDIAFVGGSLVERGGHNMLEPASLGLPVLSGPHTFNFLDISRSLAKAGGLVMVYNVDTLIETVNTLLDNTAHRRTVGKKGEQFVKANGGALEHQYRLISSTLPALPDE